MSEPADDQVQVNRVADEIGALERGVALRNAAEALGAVCLGIEDKR